MLENGISITSATPLKQHYEITEDWTGTKFGGINIKWNYAQKHAERSCRLCIKDYIKDLLLRFGHM